MFAAATSATALLRSAQSARIMPCTAPDERKPRLIYLPDIALSDSTLRWQLPSLAREYNVEALTASPDDQTDFDGLASVVTAALEQGTAPVFLVGESFGGVLALLVALQLRGCPHSNLRGLVLINAATGVELSLVPQLCAALEAAEHVVFTPSFGDCTGMYVDVHVPRPGS